MSVFTENLIISPLPDGKRWVLRKEFHYDVGEEDSGDRIEVPIGFVTDFASIPRLFWRVIPKWGKYGNAAVVHDYLYWSGDRSRKESDNIFLEAMQILGVPKWKRYLMYWAVRGFGWLSYGQKQKHEGKKLFIKPMKCSLVIPKMDLKVFEGY